MKLSASSFVKLNACKVSYQTASLPIGVRGIFMPFIAIKSISFSHLAKSHQHME